MNNLIIGIEISGTHIAAAAVEIFSGSIFPRSYVRRTVDTHGTADTIIHTWAQVVREIVKIYDSRDVRVGIAMPGPFDYENGISLIRGQHKYEALYGLDCKSLLSQQTGIPAENFRMMNDARCFLEGETFAGTTRRFNRVVGLTLGTGLGSAIYNYGLISDANLWCTPFCESIIEDYLSVRWFIDHYSRWSGRSIRNVNELEILAETDWTAQSVFRVFGTNLGNFLFGLKESYNPEAVVIGGNLARAYDRFIPSVKAVLEKKEMDVVLIRSEPAEHASLVGAAHLWSAGTAVYS